MIVRMCFVANSDSSKVGFLSGPSLSGRWPLSLCWNRTRTENNFLLWVSSNWYQQKLISILVWCRTSRFERKEHITNPLKQSLSVVTGVYRFVSAPPFDAESKPKTEIKMERKGNKVLGQSCSAPNPQIAFYDSDECVAYDGCFLVLRVPLLSLQNILI